MDGGREAEHEGTIRIAFFQGHWNKSVPEKMILT
jgi:hypothetical protein